jgi:hypothetical protein
VNSFQTFKPDILNNVIRDRPIPANETHDEAVQISRVFQGNGVPRGLVSAFQALRKV